jgi:hypothetical protein
VRGRLRDLCRCWARNSRDISVGCGARSCDLRVASGIGGAGVGRFDLAVRHIVAQPLMLCAEVNGQVRKHIPDYFWDTADGPVVVDVVRADRLTDPRITLLCDWTCQVVDSLGWLYAVVSEPTSARLANVRLLAGYRSEWLINQGILDELRSRAEQLVGMNISDAERSAATGWNGDIGDRLPQRSSTGQIRPKGLRCNASATPAPGLPRGPHRLTNG